MSIYTVTGDKNILNVSTTATSFDLNTRNQFQSTILGYEAGLNNQGTLNTLIGYKAGTTLTSGTNNTMIGGNAGLRNQGNDNVFLGTNAGGSVGYGSRNILIGSSTGRNIQGSDNVMIGNANTIGFANASQNVAIGGYQTVQGNMNTVLGSMNRASTNKSVSIGTEIANVGASSIVMGNAITNNGIRSLIINTYNATPVITASNRYTNINDFLINTLQETSVIGSNLLLQSAYTTVTGVTEFKSAVNMGVGYYASNIITPLISITGNTSNQPHWQMTLHQQSDTCSELIFKSIHGTLITFTDDFASEVLNFTGKHRCVYDPPQFAARQSQRDRYIGRIVSSTGRYQGLNGSTLPEIDESIPCVAITTRRNDPCVFGVVSGIESQGSCRNFRVGNMTFSTQKESDERRIVVNSHGEGGIWICNVNGSLRNGDLISSSGIKGYGMRQGSSTCKSYTVAKITCDCDFDTCSKVYECKTFKWKGILLKKAFVGCLYKL